MTNTHAEYEGYLYRSWGSLNSLLWSYPIVDYVSLYRLKLLREFLGEVDDRARSRISQSAYGSSRHISSQAG